MLLNDDNEETVVNVLRLMSIQIWCFFVDQKNNSHRIVAGIHAYVNYLNYIIDKALYFMYVIIF